MIDLETKLRVIRIYEGRKSVRVTARQSGESHFTIAAILKNKNKVSEVKRSASSKAMELKKKFKKGLYQTWRSF